MVESEAKELSEDIMLGAVMFGHRGFQPVMDAIVQLAESAAKEPWDMPDTEAQKKAIEQKLRQAVSAELAAAYAERQKQARSNMLEEAKAKIAEPVRGRSRTHARAASSSSRSRRRSCAAPY